MRTIYISAIFILLASLSLILLQGCANEPYSADTTIMSDITEDGFLQKPDPGAIKAMLQSEDLSIWKGLRLRILPITDIDFNPASDISIPPACEYLNNLYDRKAQKQKFLSDLDSAFEKLSGIKAGRNYSSIYVPMINELKRLSESNAQKRKIFVFSDLMENSFFSFYNPKTIKTLEQNPDAIKEILEKQAPLPNLSGIDVYFIYEPRDQNENYSFSLISKFYQKLLSEKGAKVHIGADISN